MFVHCLFRLLLVFKGADLGIYALGEDVLSTSPAIRPVIIYHIILKSLMNDHIGYLKVAGRFFSITK